MEHCADLPHNINHGNRVAYVADHYINAVAVPRLQPLCIFPHAGAA
jgi:hypothetical protein